MGTVGRSQRFSRRNPCPICSGGHDDPAGQGVRCYGFLSDDGQYAHCTREDYAGALTQGRNGGYSHRLGGTCECGEPHDGPASQGPHSPKPRKQRLCPVTRSYPIIDRQGQRVGVHWRTDYTTETGAKGKDMWWEGHNGRGSEEMPFYNLPPALAAASGARVYLVEGEHACDALTRAGVLAVGTVTGADGTPCDDTLRALEGFEVVLWPDNDGKGQQHMERIAARLAALKVATPKWVRWSDAPAKGDAFDYFAAGKPVDELAALVHEAREARAETGESEKWRPQVQTMRELMRKQIAPTRWYVDGMFAEGLTLLAAKAKKGKSTLMLHISACVADGKEALGHFDTTKGEVLYLALEDNERRMQRRMRKMLQGQAVPDGLWLVYRWLPFDMGGLQALGEWLDEHTAVKMVVVDTFEHVRPKRKIANGTYGDDYASVKEIQRFASERRIAAVIIHHLRKAAAEDPFDEINASMGLLSGVDNALVMRPVNGLMEMARRGRDFDDDSTIALKGDKRTLLWSWQGNAEEIQRSETRKAILECLKGQADGLLPIQITEFTDLRGTTVRQQLFKLLRETHSPITKDEKGRYHLADTHNTHNTHNSKPNKSNNPAAQAVSSDDGAVTEPVTDGEGDNSLCDDLNPLADRDGADTVTGVTHVTGSDKGESADIRLVCLRCGGTAFKDYGDGPRCIRCDVRVSPDGGAA